MEKCRTPLHLSTPVPASRSFDRCQAVQICSRSISIDSDRTVECQDSSLSDSSGIPASSLPSALRASGSSAPLALRASGSIGAFGSSRKRLIGAFGSSRKRLIGAFGSSRKRLIADIHSRRDCGVFGIPVHLLDALGDFLVGAFRGDAVRDRLYGDGVGDADGDVGHV